MTSSALHLGRFLALASFLALGCSSATEQASDALAEEELRTTYEDLSDNDSGRWYSVQRALIDGFDRICGDTICSGDFSNLTTIDLSCSVTSSARKMKDCIWVLGGSIGYVDGRTGAFSTEARVFSCHVPVAGTARTMLDTLSRAGDDALNTPIATGASFYDALTACFESVVGSPAPESSGSTWRDLDDHLWEVDNDKALAWNSTKREIASAFDDVCGDTFCEGDFGNISLLDISCAVRARTGRVGSCRLTFGKENLELTRRGTYAPETETATCDVTVNASQAAFLDALRENPLRANLPGQTTSLYDGLIDCL